VGNGVVINGPVPKIVSLQIISNHVRLSFTTLAGYNYRAERATNLIAPVNWSPVQGATNVPGNNAILNVTDPAAANGAQQYYRAVRLP
jgi:hypothetical protein